MFPRTKPQVIYDKCQYFPFNLPCVCLENKGEFHIMLGVFEGLILRGTSVKVQHVYVVVNFLSQVFLVNFFCF